MPAITERTQEPMGNPIPLPGMPRRGTARILVGLARQLGMEIVSQHLQADSTGRREETGNLSTQTRIDRFEALFRRYEEAISGYLWRLTGNEEVAYDLCQETFLQAWQHFDALNAHPYPNRWLFRVATRLGQHHLRHQRAVGIALPLDEQTAKPGDLATQVVERDEVHHILLLLPPEQRVLLLLRGVYGFSCDEAARILGISPDAAKKRLYRARVAFQRHVAQKGGEA